MPVARATALTPPRGSERASAAAHKRRRSSSSAANALNRSPIATMALARVPWGCAGTMGEKGGTLVAGNCRAQAGSHEPRGLVYVCPMAMSWMLNGELSGAVPALPASDEGLLRGDGAFEVVRTYGGVPFALVAHLDRLARSAKQLELPLDRALLEREIISFLDQMAGPDRQVRFLVTRAGNRLICEEPLPKVAPTLRLAVEKHLQSPLLAGVKSLSYAANMLAIRRARGRDYDDALLVSTDDVVLECPTVAFLWMAEGCLFSSPLHLGVLDSITRRALFSVTESREQQISLGGLREAEFAMVAGTGIEVRPVVEIEGLGSFPQESSAFSELRERLSQHIAEQLEVERERLAA